MIKLLKWLWWKIYYGRVVDRRIRKNWHQLYVKQLEMLEDNTLKHKPLGGWNLD